MPRASLLQGLKYSASNQLLQSHIPINGSVLFFISSFFIRSFFIRSFFIISFFIRSFFIHYFFYTFIFYTVHFLYGSFFIWFIFYNSKFIFSKNLILLHFIVKLYKKKLQFYSRYWVAFVR